MTQVVRSEPFVTLRPTLLVVLGGHLFLILAAELLAAQQLGRYTLYSSSALAVFIACVLAALVLGYGSGRGENLALNCLRERLAWNLAFITPFTALALSPEFVMSLFSLTSSWLGNSGLARAAFYASLLALPMYLLGQNLYLLQRAFSKLPTRWVRDKQLITTLGIVLLVGVAFMASLELSGYYAPVVYNGLAFATAAALGWRRVTPLLLILSSFVPAFLLASP